MPIIINKLPTFVHQIVERMEGAKMVATPCDRAGNPMGPAPYHKPADGHIRPGGGPHVPLYLDCTGVTSRVSTPDAPYRKPGDLTGTLSWSVPSTPEMVSAAERIVALECVVAELERHLAAALAYTDEVLRADEDGDGSGSVTTPIDPHELFQRAAKEIRDGNSGKRDRDDLSDAIDHAPRDKTSFPIINPNPDGQRRIGG